ncbi:helix-turn-helix domain-containing protein [Streptomyces sp. Li-HN-5-11]|uniref:TetR/AcrR family transcriptional regulator n=1 Tax=Streptomyces sp. Li-HN-5-11 TaxID=3075432 RepID=UPI0028B040BB|nr:helix-turn-helix domain-containing protein [Streptomyces sp. Li-HN-5-11]WNM36779.1 helix-turn-helix domain-containing protein [Streptomyces sp. Li-HN-5-11]
MEIARAAARLFVSRGLRATRAEDIAQAAGIAPRTFYRYFAAKEESVAPLYTAGAQRWTDAVRDAPACLSVPEALNHAVRRTFTPDVGVSAASWQWVRTLIRLAGTNPAVRKVWAEVCQASEGALADVLAARMAAADAVDDNVAEGMEATEHGATAEAGEAPGSAVDAAEVTETTDAGCATRPVSPELRFAAAVASAAVRVAVEAWATGEAPADGPQGPAALALRNLAALRDFTWEPEPD